MYVPPYTPVYLVLSNTTAVDIFLIEETKRRSTWMSSIGGRKRATAFVNSNTIIINMNQDTMNSFGTSDTCFHLQSSRTQGLHIFSASCFPALGSVCPERKGGVEQHNKNTTQQQLLRVLCTVHRPKSTEMPNKSYEYRCAKRHSMQPALEPTELKSTAPGARQTLVYRTSKYHVYGPAPIKTLSKGVP